MLLIMQFPPPSCHFISPQFKYSPKHLILEHLQSVLWTQAQSHTGTSRIFKISPTCLWGRSSGNLWCEAKILGIESNSMYMKYKKLDHMAC
jgi:hypothetical protein